MKIIISPAKKLSAENFVSDMNSENRFINESTYLVNLLKNYSKSEIKKLMNLSGQLAELNYRRFQDCEVIYSKAPKAMELKYPKD